MDASVAVGTPAEPNAVGVVFTTRQAVTALMGLRPIPARIDAGIATAVPNPAIPSIKLPNPQPIISISILLSSEIPISIPLIISIAPVFIVKLYVKRAAIIIKQIGQSAYAAPSSIADEICSGGNFQYNAANIAVISSAIPQALQLLILSLLKEIISQTIGSIASIKLINIIYYFILQGKHIIG